MTKAKYLLLLAAATTFLPACTQAERGPAGEDAQMNTAADESAIGAINQRWMELIRSKDSAAIAQAVVLGDGQPALSAVLWPVRPDADDRALQAAVDGARSSLSSVINR